MNSVYNIELNKTVVTQCKQIKKEKIGNKELIGNKEKIGNKENIDEKRENW